MALSVSSGYSNTKEIDKSKIGKDFDLAGLKADIHDLWPYVIDLPDLAFNVYGFGVGFAPTFTFGVKGSVSATFSCAVDFSVYYDSQTMDKVEMDCGFKKLVGAEDFGDLAEGFLGLNRSINASFAADGDMYATLDPGLGIWPVTSKLGGIFIPTPVTLNVGVSAKTEANALNNSEITYSSFNTSNPMHYCPICFDLDVSLKLAVNLKAVLLKCKPLEAELASKTITLGKWYYSPFAEGKKFGAGSCPHKAKEVKMYIKGNMDYPASEADVYIDDDFRFRPDSDAVVNGKATFYSKPKDIFGNDIEHSYVVKSEGVTLAEGTFTIGSDSVIEVKINKKKDDDTTPIERQKIENPAPPTEAPTEPPYVKPEKARSKVTPGREMLSGDRIGDNTWYSAFTDNGTGYIDISGYGEITGSIPEADKSKITHAAIVDEATFINESISDDTLLDRFIYKNRDELIADYVEAHEDKNVEGDENKIEETICSATDRDEQLKKFITDNIDTYRTKLKEFKNELVEDADSKVITNIGEYFFDGCENLETVILPANLERIEPFAFRNCSKLSSITYEGSPNMGKKAIDLPPTLKFIGASAFENCSSLEGEFILSDQIEEIGSVNSTLASSQFFNGRTFAGCSGLTNIVIPNSSCKMQYIEMFESCSSLKELTLPSIDERFSNQFGFNVNNPETYEKIPASLKKITILSTTDIPSGDSIIKTIPSSALEDFSRLETVVIPADVEDIGSYAFKNCKGLRQITYAGSENPSKSPIDIPVTVKNIGTSAFEECASLAGEVTLPSSLENIHSYAFSGCSSLTELTIPKSVKNIGEHSYYGTFMFTGRCFANCSALTKLTILNPSCQMNYSEMFEDCSSLKELTIPVLPERFSNQFGYSATNPERVNKIPASLKKITVLKATEVPSGDSIIKTIPSTALEDFSEVETVVIPADVEDISSYAFKNCTGLKQITYAGSKNPYKSPIDLPNTVITIGSHAFENCASLAGEVTLPSSLENIRSYAFSGCSSLTGELIIPEKVRSIGEDSYFGSSRETGCCFVNCSGLTKITIPNPSCSMYYSYMFDGCSSLEELTVPTVKDYFVGEFGGAEKVSKSLKKITVLSVTDSNNTVKNLPASAFESFPYIETVIIPADVESIGSYAFKNCPNLKKISYIGSRTSSRKNVDLPPSIAEIGKSAFMNCTSLSGDFVLSDSISMINDAAFAGCTSIESIVIPEGVERIAGYAVINESAEKMIDLYIPESMKFIDRSTFGRPFNQYFGTVHYAGSEEDWNKIEIMDCNEAIMRDQNENLNIVFNSKPEPAVSTKPGDANGDGIVNVADAVAVLQYIANRMKYDLDEQALINADVDGEPGITGGDVIAIQKIDAGILVID